MSRASARRRLKQTYRLVNDVCQLRDNAQRWTDRLLEGLVELFQAKFAALAWAQMPSQPGQFIQSDVNLQLGLTPAEVQLWAETYAGPDGTFQSELLRRVVNIPSQFVTVRRQDVMSDEEWYALPEVQTTHRACNVDANMVSNFVSLSLGRIFGIGIHRPWDAPQFTPDDRRQLRLLHLELARTWRGRTANSAEPNGTVRSLPERLRQVLWLLCLGRSEKEIAAHLALSTHTVHNHVRRLYELMGVHSRGELLSQAFRSVGLNGFVDLPAREMNQLSHDSVEVDTEPSQEA